MNETDIASFGEHRVRILVVEPNRSYCGVLARRLGAAGYLVKNAADRELVKGALENSDLLPRIRTAVPAGVPGADAVSGD